jgi:hypothetical protein
VKEEDVSCGVFGATNLEVEFEKVVAAPCGSQKEKGWR